MGKFIDLTGQRFGRLTVIERTANHNGRTCWKCQCDCGNVKNVIGKDLRNGKTRSCGCYNREVCRHVTHGLSKTKIYKVWCDMRDRCFNPKKERYPQYGGRGITVCDEWAKSDCFPAFYEYVSKLEHFGEDGYTLDRIDVNGNYEPSNIRWATDAEQRRNRTDNHYIEIGGKQMVLADVVRIAGVTRKTIYDRLARGEEGERLLRPARAK